MATAIATRSAATSWALALSGVAGAFAADAHTAIRSSRGVQHQTPMISDDFIVGCINVSAWVPIGCDRAVRFHELAGFTREMSSAKTVPVGTVKIEEIRLKRALS